MTREAQAHGPRRPKAWSEHGRVFRTLTFWLRPAFALRVVGRFQAIVGFDRAIALASSALTAIIPLAIIFSIVADKLGGKDLSERLIDRYDLSGAGAEAVERLFSPAGGTETSIGVIGFLLLIVALLSFTRAVQRLFEQTWELDALSVRNTLNGLKWLGGLIAYFAAQGLMHALIDSGHLELLAWSAGAPLTCVFLIWSGWILSAQRIEWRTLLPFGIAGAVLLSIYSIGATAYVPHLFNSYSARYGAIGAVFAMISTLFCIMVVVVASAALGREIRDELDRIKRGERPPEDEIRQEWDVIVSQARDQWQNVRHRLKRGEGSTEPPSK
jgi:membrane protein